MMTYISTFVIFIAIVATVYQLYKYVKRMYNFKGTDTESFQNSNSLFSKNNKPANEAAKPSTITNSAEINPIIAMNETFDFDNSEVGSFSTFGNYEEYTGPSLA